MTTIQRVLTQEAIDKIRDQLKKMEEFVQHSPKITRAAAGKNLENLSFVSSQLEVSQTILTLPLK